jgi:LCP family protein required for cell wall assembly
MFLVTMDPRSKTAGILSIPRDMWVTIPGSGEGRINEAFPRGGASLAMKTVEQTLGVSVQYYVIIDFAGFTKIIDTLGGIQVDVPERVRQEDYSPDDVPGHFTPKEFLPGRQYMNGEDALAYARIRIGSSDLDRIRRQQLVMFAVMDKVMDLRLLPIAFDLWKRYRDTVTTNISDVQAAGLIKLAADIGPDNVAASAGRYCAGTRRR